MSKTPDNPSVTSAGPGCLIETVTAAMQREPSLEAVQIDREKRAISFATLGQSRQQDFARTLTAQIRALEQPGAEEACGLVTGKYKCDQCSQPAAHQPHPLLNIRHEENKSTIARVTCPTSPSFWRWRELPWPKFVPRQVEFGGHEHHEDEWKIQLVLAVLCGALGIAGALLTPGTAKLVCFIGAYLAGSWFAAEEIWEGLQKRTLDVHFLMLAVAVGSAAIGAWGEGATLLFLFSFSGALEHYAMGRTQKEIRSLFKTAPKSATRLDDRGHETVVPVESITAGQRLLVKPGEQFPVDAEIVKGATASDESNLTGEAVPVEKKVGDTVLSGTINLWGVVEVVVLRPVQESALSKIIQLIEQAQHLKAPSQRFTDKFSSTYTYVVLALSATMFFVWWLGFGLPAWTGPDEHNTAFYRTMTLLVVGSPCALVLSIPSAILAAIAWAARRGILFRGGAAVEKLAEVNVVAMDKTGTLTTGELQVERIESFPPGRETELFRLAYSMERLSNHPLARAITRHGKQQGVVPLELDDFSSVTGAGLQALAGGERVYLGKRAWLTQVSSTPLPPVETAASLGSSEIWLAWGSLVGRITLRDDLRLQAREVVESLRAAGLQTVVLTGDHAAAAENLKKQLDLDDVRAGLKPEQKVAAIESFNQQGRKVAMIGDGVNDAPSLAAAHVGVAMGARGADAALEQAEVVLMHDRLENFLTAYRLSHQARSIIRQNLVISLGTVAVLTLFALAGQIPLTIGVVGHEGSTVVVVMNGLRLLLGGVRTPAKTVQSMPTPV